MALSCASSRITSPVDSHAASLGLPPERWISITLERSSRARYASASKAEIFGVGVDIVQIEQEVHARLGQDVRKNRGSPSGIAQREVEHAVLHADVGHHRSANRGARSARCPRRTMSSGWRRAMSWPDRRTTTPRGDRCTTGSGMLAGRAPVDRASACGARHRRVPSCPPRTLPRERRRVCGSLVRARRSADENRWARARPTRRRATAFRVRPRSNRPNHEARPRGAP